MYLRSTGKATVNIKGEAMKNSHILRRPMRVSDYDNFDEEMYEGQQINRAERTRIRREREIRRQLV